MNIELLDLKNLQEVDDQTEGDRKVLEEGAARLAEGARRMKAFEDKLAGAREELAAMRTRHRELEAEVADLSVKKAANEKRQMAVKSNNEYTALQKEAEYLAGRINESEDEILALLDRIEKREVEIGELELVVTEEAAVYARAAAATEKAEGRSRARLAVLAERRLGLVAAIPAPRMRQYEDIAKRRKGIAVTAAADGLCLACRLGFPPQVYNDLQRNEKILTCPNCGRIIFWRDHPDFKEEETA